MAPPRKQTATSIAIKYQNGATIQEIADECGVSYTTVWRRLKELGVNIRHRGAPPKPLSERFFELFTPEPNTGCWLWLGTTGYRNGYPYMRVGSLVNGTRSDQLAHRVSYELHVGNIPNGMHIDHTCRVRSCVNPTHLEAVTQAENNRRAVRVRRQKWAR